MKTLLLCGLMAAYAVSCHSYAGKEQPPEGQQPAARGEQTQSQWRPAVYRGLVIGKSTRRAMVRVLGKPKWAGPPGHQAEDDSAPETWYEYEGGGEFPGKLTVVTDRGSGIILAIDVLPESLTKEQAIGHFGDGYVVTRYDFDECLGDGESAPLYESANGPLTNVEYRERGIAIAVDEDGKVSQISYVSKPVGASVSKCIGKDKSTG